MARKASSRTRSQASPGIHSRPRRAARRATWRKPQSARLRALANLAHELRTPLQVLLGYLEILRDEWAEAFQPEPRAMLERMNVSLHELSHTVDNLMEFVLAEAGGMMRVQEEISLNALLADLAPAIDAARTDKAVELKFDLDDAPSTLHAPRRPLRSILSNLVINAIKYTERGNVTVRIGRARERGAEAGLEIEVRDTGPGIDPALIKLVSQPFARLSNPAGHNNHRGLGLGLAVVQRNADALGATVEIDSTPGQGSRFVVRIPAASGSAHARDGQRASRRGRASGAATAPPRSTATGEAVAPVAFI